MLSALPERLKTLKQDKFLRAAGVLVGGTAAAQGIGLLALPLLTRFYTPEDFSLLAVYVAILTMAAAVTCLRLDTAIPLPESDGDAANLLALALTSAATVIVLSGLVVYYFGSTLANSLGRPEIAPYLWLVPFGIGLMGLYSSFQYMAMRQKAFRLIARTKVTQAMVGLGSQVGLGWVGVTPLGLLLGHALMSGAGVVALALRTTWQRTADRAPFAKVNWSSMVETLRTYRRFPQYSVAEELTNNAGIQVPILLIGVFLIGPEAGFLFLAMRVVGTPMSVIGGAVSQVYYAHAAEYLREGRLAEETARVFRRLSTWFVLPMVALGPFAPEVFRVVFGPEWERAGELLVWMLPWYAFRLISSPISMVMHVKMKQRLMLVLTVAGLLLRLGPLGIVLAYQPEMASATYAVTSAIFYAGISVVFMAVSGMPGKIIAAQVIVEAAKWAAVSGLAFLVIGVL